MLRSFCRRVVGVRGLVAPERSLQDFLRPGMKGDTDKPVDVTTGRPWKADELRSKSWEDLHKLWWVMVKERNRILTEKLYAKHQGGRIHHPERMRKVKTTMARIKTVLGERDRSGLPGETGFVPFAKAAMISRVQQMSLEPLVEDELEEEQPTEQKQ